MSEARLLIFHPALPPYRLDLFNALAKRCRMRLVVLRPNLLNQEFDQARLRAELVADCVELTRGFTICSRTVRIGLGREIRQFKPDVVVSDEFSPTTLAIVTRRIWDSSFRHVIWTDDNPTSVTADNFLRRWMRRRVLPRVDGLVVLSEEAARLYTGQYGAVVPIAVSPILQDDAVFRSQLAAATESAEVIVREHRLQKRRVVLFVGRIAREKRIDRLVAAFASVQKDVPDAVLALVGDGPEQRSLRTLVGELGITSKVIFAGRQEGAALHGWYRVSSLFALASEAERFGAVVNEALLAGLPVVCSDRAGARVLIREGENGTIVDAASPEGLRVSLLEWLVRVSPLTSRDMECVRPSLMAASFSDSVDQIVRLVQQIAAEKVHR